MVAAYQHFRLDDISPYISSGLKSNLHLIPRDNVMSVARLLYHVLSARQFELQFCQCKLYPWKYYYELISLWLIRKGEEFKIECILCVKPVKCKSDLRYWGFWTNWLKKIIFPNKNGFLSINVFVPLLHF